MFMSEETNKKSERRVVKGTGFYTPMDIAPGEVPPSKTPTTPTVTVGESLGLPTSMNVTPPVNSSPQTTETSEANNGANS